jgi:hypothetical protein
VVRRPSNFEILDTTLDVELVANFGRLADRVAKVEPRLKGMMVAIKAAVGAAKGMRVRDVLHAARLSHPARPGPQGKPRKRKKK